MKWITGDYQDLYIQVKELQRRVVCYVDYDSSIRGEPADILRDICTIKGPVLNLLARGICYGDPTHPAYTADTEMDRFVQMCEYLNVQWLNELPGGANRPRDPRALIIADVVTRSFNGDFTVRKRAHRFVRPRMIFMMLIRKHTGITLKEIGEMFGWKYDHTTVIHSINTIRNDIKQNADLRHQVEAIEAEILSLI